MMSILNTLWPFPESLFLKEDEEGVFGGREFTFGYGSSVMSPHSGVRENNCQFGRS